jgi:8-oxo-dGTP pyrophosphatase MutT (NUDIX family)
MSSPRVEPRRRPLGHGRVDPAEAPVKPRDASTLIVWRRGEKGAEVLMGRRSRRAAFVPDFFVFPGGRLDPADYTIRSATSLDSSAIKRMAVRGNSLLAQALAITAVRETFEETGLLLAGSGDVGETASADWAHWKERGLAPQLDRLSYFGRAITSRISPIRFHARFFIVEADALEGELGGSGELAELGFYPARDVLEHMPIVDVTEFMLSRVISYAAAPSDFSPRRPVFSYKGDVAFVRYE